MSSHSHSSSTSTTSTTSITSSSSTKSAGGATQANNNDSKTSPWGDTPFTPREVPGLPGYFVYTKEDFEDWRQVRRYLSAIHELRIRKNGKIVPRESQQMDVMWAVGQDSYDELTRRAVSEHLHLMLEFYDPRTPIMTWPVAGDRYNK